MMYTNEVIYAIGKEIFLLKADNEYYQKKNEKLQQENEKLQKENDELREQIERMIKEQVLDPVFGEGKNG